MHRASDGSGILRRSCISISTEPAEDTAYSTPGRPNHQYILSFNLCTYNGNISAQRWGADTTYHSTFNYTYDRLNRLINGTSTGTVAIGETLTYDVMGNINSMVRVDGSLSKSGTYSYIGNRLTNISGGTLATGNYGYDANGNATIDGRAGVTLTYNHLNLPVTAGKTGLSLVYTYDAMGSKVKKVSTTTATTTTDYVNGIQYTNGAIDFISTEEGKAVRNGASYVYEYNLTDHLGNVRYVFNKHPTTGAIQPLQTSDYYPFGKRFGTGGTNNYLYNGKELQEGLDQYDYGARFYDVEVGRWNVVDPLAEKMVAWSAYNYAFCNPIRFIDIAGLAPYDHIFDTQGRLLYTTKTGSNILVKTGGQLVNISDLTYSAKNNQTIANIAGYYGSEVGIPRGTIGVKPTKRTTLAFTFGDNINVNNRGGQIDEALGNYNNLKSTLVHEKEHLSKDHGTKNISSLEHAEVYSSQFADKTFKNTTSDFKTGVIGSVIGYLQDSYNKEGFQLSSVEQLVGAINQSISKFGYQLTVDPSTTIMTIRFYDNNKKDNKKQ